MQQIFARELERSVQRRDWRLNAEREIGAGIGWLGCLRSLREVADNPVYVCGCALSSDAEITSQALHSGDFQPVLNPKYIQKFHSAK